MAASSSSSSSPPKQNFLDSFPAFRRARTPPPKNTDSEVDCTPYEHIKYRPFCQTIRLRKRRKAQNKPKRQRLSVIMENLNMFEWLHRVGAHKSMTTDELLFVLTNGLFHQDKGNVAIVFNKDNRTGKSATSRMNAAFGKADDKKDAVKEFMDAHNSPKVNFSVPENIKRYGCGHVIRNDFYEEEVPSPIREIEIVTLD
ncbi:hypothetical protein GCK72_001800 [Caenorhabditis remanei]|uniref:Uncharacterized protein n=1 Tax=Caenorhabditis remanei TaxID=31234 RepID=A0A6A5HUR4_CAERE|nr:hypothetical protein GCK72_001800 [Caenorhabditis remanei]KAF1769983.1 hypothetical protein GCK72_001800 [Caenorhabditis remanei]